VQKEETYKNALDTALEPVNPDKPSENIKLALSYDDVLLIPRYSSINSRSEVDTSTQITPNVRLKIPLISINMDSVTGVEMATKLANLGGMGFLPRFDKAEIQAQMATDVKKSGGLVGVAIGCKNGFMERAELLVKAGVDIITLDIAHGHMQKALDATRELKNRFNDVGIISGVVATYEGAKDLFLAGADCVRVGVGPGTICTTRTMTGCGVPQITAVMEAARAAREFKKTILCDGGTKSAGDVVKGLAAGASAVVIGSQFAGCDEANGELVVIRNGTKKHIRIFGIKLFEIAEWGSSEKFKRYNASTSKTEKIKQIKKDGSDKNGDYTDYIEGVESLVPYSGPLEGVVNKILAGVKSGLSYNGASTIEELWEKAEFIQVTHAGIIESGAHHVITTHSTHP